MKIHFFKSFFLSKLFSVTSLCVENSKLSFWTPSHFKIWPKCYFALLTDAHVGLSRRCTKNGFRSKRSEKFSWPLAFESHLQLACWMILSDQLIGPGQASARAGGRPFVFASRQWQATTPTYFLTLPHLQSCDSSCCCVGVRAMPWPSTSRHRFSWQLSQRIFTYFARGSLIVSMISCFTCLDAATLLVFN